MKKIAAVKNFSEPVTIKELCQFLGLVSYQRRFIKNTAELLSPLQDYLKGKVKNETKISLNCNALQTFKKVKEIIANLSYLAHPKAYAKLQLKKDASATSLDGVLEQIYDDKIEVLSCYSKSLIDAQKHYSTYDLELLSVYSNVRYFEYMLLDKPFVIFTYNKPYLTVLQDLLKITLLGKCVNCLISVNLIVIFNICQAETILWLIAYPELL